jgi:hypothetical protein
MDPEADHQPLAQWEPVAAMAPNRQIRLDTSGPAGENRLNLLQELYGRIIETG